jgi:hypothetical protein
VEFIVPLVFLPRGLLFPFWLLSKASRSDAKRFTKFNISFFDKRSKLDGKVVRLLLFVSFVSEDNNKALELALDDMISSLRKTEG